MTTHHTGGNEIQSRWPHPPTKTNQDSVGVRGSRNWNKCRGSQMVFDCRRSKKDSCGQSRGGLSVRREELPSAWEEVGQHAIFSEGLQVKGSVAAVLSVHMPTGGKECVCNQGGCRGNCKKLSFWKWQGRRHFLWIQRQQKCS